MRIKSQRGKATNSQRGMGEEPGDKGLWGGMEIDRDKQSDREGGRRERLLPWTPTLHSPLSPTVHPVPPQTGGDPEKSLGPSVCRAQLALSCPAGLAPDLLLPRPLRGTPLGGRALEPVL